MKSRLAISVLFTLVAASFLPNATVAVAKLRLRAGKIVGCTAVHTTGRVAPDEKADVMNVLQAFSSARPNGHLDSLRATGSDDKDLQFLTTASRIRKILDVMHIK